MRRIFRACVKPMGQGAVLLEHQKPPCQLDHAAPDSRVTGSSQPFLATLLTALVRRAGEAPIARHRPTVNRAATCPSSASICALMERNCLRNARCSLAAAE